MSHSEFEPRINGSQLKSGGYTDYCVILVGSVVSMNSPNSFTIQTSDDEQITLYCTPDQAAILQQQSEQNVQEVFEINGRVEQDASLTAISILPLFDDATDSKKEFDMKLYDKLVNYWTNGSLLNMFFPEPSS